MALLYSHTIQYLDNVVTEVISLTVLLKSYSTTGFAKDVGF
jgi:hypothetical protein